eukprot:gene10652-biopygen6296
MHFPEPLCIGIRYFQRRAGPCPAGREHQLASGGGTRLPVFRGTGGGPAPPPPPQRLPALRPSAKGSDVRACRQLA